MAGKPPVTPADLSSPVQVHTRRLVQPSLFTAEALRWLSSPSAILQKQGLG